MIHVVATIELADGQRDAFLEHFHRLVPLVHEEQGCIEYGPTIDLNTGLERQAPLEDNVVVIVEKWESLDDLKAHLVAPHMNAYRKRVQDMVENGHLRITQPA